MKKLTVATFALASLLTLPAQAADEGLYDPAPPAGSAFVRVVNPTAKDVTPSIRGKAIDAVKAGAVGSYVPAKKGAADVKLDKVAQKLDLDEGAFYTVVYNGDKANVLKDEAIKNDTKAMIAFYNLTTKANVSLKTADGKIEVVKPVGVGQSAYREINAVNVKLAVYEGDNKLSDVDTLALRRSEPTAVVLTEKAGVLTVQTVQAKTDTTQ